MMDNSTGNFAPAWMALAATSQAYMALEGHQLCTARLCVSCTLFLMQARA
jgi:hypothetical protein